MYACVYDTKCKEKRKKKSLSFIQDLYKALRMSNFQILVIICSYLHWQFYKHLHYIDGITSFQLSLKVPKGPYYPYVFACIYVFCIFIFLYLTTFAFQQAFYTIISI